MSNGRDTSGLQTGLPTLHARAEAWECDFNGHWNTRYYCRAFQRAGEVAAAIDGHPDRESRLATGWHLRFHSEMHSGDPVLVRSVDVTDTDGVHRTVHAMFRDDALVSTALALGQPRNASLPSLPAERAALGLPRGITGPVTAPWNPDPERDFLSELGPVTDEDLHADGNLQLWTAVARLSAATHVHDLGIGFTLELMQQGGITRMLAEMRYTRLGPCSPRDFLRAASHLTSARGKAFTAAHCFYTHDGRPVAMFELCTLAVDVKTRRATDLPDFVVARVK